MSAINRLCLPLPFAKQCTLTILCFKRTAISFGKYEQIVPLRRTKPVNAHVFGNQHVETKVYLMLPTDETEVTVDGCGVFEGKVLVDPQAAPTEESWIDTQVEETDKSNEF